MTTATATRPAEDNAAPPKSKKKLVIILAVLLLAAGAGGYFFVIKPSGGSKEAEPGAVVPLDHVQINLAEGHYLRLGLSLQLTAEASGEHAGELDGSQALDAAIEVFSGRDVAELAKEGQRAKLKKELLEMVEERYHHEVMDLYFTEFVTE